MLFEEYNACYSVNSYDEMKNALRNLYTNRDYLPYSQSDVQKVLTEVVSGGKENRDVLQDYVDFILQVKERKEHPELVLQ